MTALEKAAKAIRDKADAQGCDCLFLDDKIYMQTLARAAIESLRTHGNENTDRIFNAMLDRILHEQEEV